MAHPFSKLIWAVTPVAMDQELEQKTFQFMQLLKPKSIEPVAVFDSAAFDPKFPPPQEMVKNRCDPFESENLQPLKILETKTSRPFSTKEKSRTLVEHCDSGKADALVLTTAGKQGLERLVMGSFAENTILQSHVPTITVNPHFQPPQAIETVFFATDLSDESHKAYERALGLAEHLGAQMVLFHKVTSPSSLYVGPYGVMTNDLRNLDEDHMKQVEKKLEEWKKEGESKNLTVNTILETSQTPMVEAIIEATNNQPSPMVAMAARSGPMEATLLGSTTRKVIRRSTCPVWTIHS